MNEFRTLIALTSKCYKAMEIDCADNIDEVIKALPERSMLMRPKVFERIVSNTDRDVTANYLVKCISVRMTDDEYYNFEDIV